MSAVLQTYSISVLPVDYRPIGNYGIERLADKPIRGQSFADISLK